jgi:hypothetical protein
MLTLLISSGRPVFQHRVEVLVRSFRMHALIEGPDHRPMRVFLYYKQCNRRGEHGQHGDPDDDA